MSRTHKTGLLAGQWQDIVQDCIEQVRAGVSLHQFKSILRIYFDLDVATPDGKSASLHMAKVTNQIATNLLTICKKTKIDRKLAKSDVRNPETTEIWILNGVFTFIN